MTDTCADCGSAGPGNRHICSLCCGELPNEKKHIVGHHKPDWIPVSERKPVNDGFYYIYTEDNKKAIDLFEKGFWFLDDDGMFFNRSDYDSRYQVKYWLDDPDTE